jgi:hypothetical protein
MLMGIPNSNINLFIVLLISISSLALAGTMAVLCFSKASGIMFLGNARTEKASAVTSDVERVMLIPMGIMAMATFFIGTYPQYIVNFIFSPVSLFIERNYLRQTEGLILNFLESLSWYMFIFLVIIMVVYTIRKLLIKSSKEHDTWGCGYDRPNPHMQYTPSSYDNLFVSTLKNFVPVIK